MKLEMFLNVDEITIFLLLTGLGTMANVSIFVNQICTFVGSRKKSIHLILIHLAFTNIIMFLLKGMQITIGALGLRHFLGDLGCHILLYLRRVARGVSICTSSLLTVVQAIIISPRASGWGSLKLRSPGYVLLSLLFFWILNSVISMNVLHSIRNRGTNTLQLSNGKYCYFRKESQKINNIFLMLMVLRDAVFQGAMGGASGYMVLLLHKHHQHVLYLQNSKLLYRTPPELKAAQSVLLLMLCFVFFYWTDCFVSLHLSFSWKNDSLTMHFQEFLTLGYAVFSPWILIHRDGHLAKCWHAQ